MKQLITIAVTIATAMVAQSQVILSPGDSSQLAQVGGSGWGAGGVQYDSGGITVNVGALSLDYPMTGWAVRESDDVLVQALQPTGLAFGGAFTVPTQLALSTEYYLLIGTDGTLGDTASSVSYASVITEGFILVPEPSTYAILAGLGLVSFAGIRRFRR